MDSEASTEQNAGNIEGLVCALGLQPCNAELFIGKVRGFPVGLKFIGVDDSMVLLFQIRYPMDAESNTVSKLAYGTEVNRLISDKGLEISVENRVAWVSFFEGGKHITSNSVPRILNQVITAFEEAGLSGLQDKCHYCKIEKVEMLTCMDGKVAQICKACLDTRKASSVGDLKMSAGGAGKVLILGSLASIAGAFSWMLVWIGYDAIFELSHAGALPVPRLVEAVVIAVVGFLVGGPVGFIIKRIPQRGDLLAAWAGVVFGITSCALGEILYVVWLIYHEFKVVSFSGALKVLPQYLGDSGSFYLTMKTVSGFISVFVAYQMARLKKTGLKL